MKTIKNSKEITTLEVGDKVIFGDLEYVVWKNAPIYYLDYYRGRNDKIFIDLNLNKRNFVEKLGINANCNCDFPETKSLEALTAIVSALFKEYEKNKNELPKTWEEFCERNSVTPNEYWIDTVYSKYCNISGVRKRDINMDKNVCVSLQEAQAFTALMQLRQLRKCYVKDWEPDWKDMNTSYGVIWVNKNEPQANTACTLARPLSFPDYKMAKDFLETFRDLIEKAKILI